MTYWHHTIQHPLSTMIYGAIFVVIACRWIDQISESSGYRYNTWVLHHCPSEIEPDTVILGGGPHYSSWTQSFWDERRSPWYAGATFKRLRTSPPIRHGIAVEISEPTRASIYLHYVTATVTTLIQRYAPRGSPPCIEQQWYRPTSSRWGSSASLWYRKPSPSQVWYTHSDQPETLSLSLSLDMEFSFLRVWSRAISGLHFHRHAVTIVYICARALCFGHNLRAHDWSCYR